MPLISSRGPCYFAEVPDGSHTSILNVLRSKNKEPKYVCLSEAKDSHSHRMWAEVLSSAPHLLHNGLSVNPIR